jgi:hypothetical protein
MLLYNENSKQAISHQELLQFTFNTQGNNVPKTRDNHLRRVLRASSVFSSFHTTSGEQVVHRSEETITVVLLDVLEYQRTKLISVSLCLDNNHDFVIH